ncbi:MAG: radical SAM protein [Clostridiales bacterium]|nr:radical SAM protein [Clostridiales bacterium]
MGNDTEKNRTRRLTLVMTHQCNFDCRYCLQKHEDVYMPRQTALKAIDIMVDALRQKPGKAQISFYGGEPLLAREEIEYLVAYARSRVSEIPGASIVFEITTNGTLLDESFITFAKENKLLLALSHDGVAQDRVRVDRGGHPTKEVVDSKLAMLLKTFPETIIMMTVHPEQVERIAESLEFFYSKGVRAVNLVPAHGERVVWTEEKFALLQQELTKVKELYVKWNQGQAAFRFIPFENKIRNYIRGKDADNAMCHFGGHKIMVDVDGRYYPCSHFIGREGFCIGSVDENLDVEKVESLEAQRVEAGICRDCELRARCRHTCACANHGHTGCMSEVSALQCEYEKLVIRLADEAASALISEENPRFVERMYKE